MKEKITLFIALSFLIGLTAYKKSFETDSINALSDVHIENEIDAVKISKVNNPKVDLNNMKDENESCESDPSKTDTLEFSKAFKYYRNCNHDTFLWNGIEYTTILKSEINENVKENHEPFNNKMDLVSK